MKTLYFVICVCGLTLLTPNLSVAYFSDNFEDGVIDSSLWVVGGSKGGVGGPGSGGGQWFNEEKNGYLEARVTTPTSGNTYGANAWTRTVYNFNDGRPWEIKFGWEGTNQGNRPWHADYHLIEITDGRTDWGDALMHPPPWQGVTGNDYLVV